MRIITDSPYTMVWTEWYRKHPPHGWEELFEELSDEFQATHELLEKEAQKYGPWIPSPWNLFRAFQLTPRTSVKVVMVTSKPLNGYVSGTTDLRSQGLAFSVRHDDLIPQATRLIYRELQDTILDFYPPSHGDLTDWALRGVLLLTMSLTSSPGRDQQESGNISHSRLWGYFIRRTLETVFKTNKHAVFVFFGKEVQGLRTYLSSKALILDVPYPTQSANCDEPFLGGGWFAKINQWLMDHQQTPIDWCLSPRSG